MAAVRGLQSDDQGQCVPSVPTCQLLDQGRQEGSQGPLPPPAALRPPCLSSSPAVFSVLNTLALLPLGAPLGTPAPGLWPRTLPGPSSPGVAVASFCPQTPVTSSCTSVTILLS